MFIFFPTLTIKRKSRNFEIFYINRVRLIRIFTLFMFFSVSMFCEIFFVGRVSTRRYDFRAWFTHPDIVPVSFSVWFKEFEWELHPGGWREFVLICDSELFEGQQDSCYSNLCIWVAPFIWDKITEFHLITIVNPSKMDTEPWGVATLKKVRGSVYEGGFISRRMPVEPMGNLVGSVPRIQLSG